MIRIQKFMIAQNIPRATIADAYTMTECLIARKIISEHAKRIKNARRKGK